MSRKSPRPLEDDGSSPEALFWIGYMLARAVDHSYRCEIAEKVGVDSDNVRFDPPHRTFQVV